MHSLNSKTVIASKIVPGVEIVVRTLNVVQRAKRDAKVACHRAEYSRLLAERRTLLDKLIGKDGTDAEREEKYQNLPADQKAQDQTLFEQSECILQQHLVPATIQAALIEVRGYEIDGAPATVETLIEHAPDAFLGEVYNACVFGSGLTGEEAKN